MKDAKITPLTIQQYADISEHIHDEVDRVEFAGMLAAKITPLTIQQYADISEHIHDEVDRVEFAGMIAAKCTRHPDYGDIILISTSHGECLMIHFADLQ